MQANPVQPSYTNFFNETSDDLMYIALKFSPLEAMNPTNKQIASISETRFSEYNTKIIQLCPALNKIYVLRNLKTEPKKLFMQLMNRLHDEAKHLGYDIVAPLGVNRLEGECAIFRELAELNGITEYLKAKDFKTFVQAVAEQLKIPVTLKVIEAKVDSLTNDQYKEKIEEVNSHNRQVWKRVLITRN